MWTWKTEFGCNFLQHAPGGINIVQCRKRICSVTPPIGPLCLYFFFRKINATTNIYLPIYTIYIRRNSSCMENLFVYGNVVLLPKSISENCTRVLVVPRRCCYSLLVTSRYHLHWLCNRILAKILAMLASFNVKSLASLLYTIYTYQLVIH